MLCLGGCRQTSWSWRRCLRAFFELRGRKDKEEGYKYNGTQPVTGKIEDLSRARLMLENKIKSAPHAERLAPRIIVGFPFRTSRQSDCPFARSVRGSMGPGRLTGAEIVLSPFRLLVFSRQPQSCSPLYSGSRQSVTSLPLHILLAIRALK